MAFARNHEADLLIAIHADASLDRKTRGASVYVRSGNEATRLPTIRSDSNHVGTTLSASHQIPQAGSSFLQFTMIEQLDDDVRMVAGPARSAPLYVLGSRVIPSVLLEMGFLTNRQDEALLRQSAHR